MIQVQCPGLPADWVNAWLAAIGATVLDHRIRLHWTSQGSPMAVLSAQGTDPVECLIESWPDAGFLADLPVAETWSGTAAVKRKVPVEAFRERVQAARGHRHAWTLSSTMTDLCVDQDGYVAHAPFDPPAPKGAYLHQRLVRVHEHVDPNANHIQDALRGQPILVKNNGLGFDQGRLASSSDATDPLVNPVVEVLAFFGLCLLPVRGPGTDRRLDGRANIAEQQRGFMPLKVGVRRNFCWPAWTPPLGRDGIDALLDSWDPAQQARWPLLGIHSAWQSVQYQHQGALDATRAFGSARL